jgi:hypothetical protein
VLEAKIAYYEGLDDLKPFINNSKNKQGNKL